MLQIDSDSRDYNKISPSANSLLFLKGLTDIPFAKETAELIVSPDKYSPDLENKDIAFWKRVVHFEQRYWSVDNALTDLQITNILEISSGFSFRGLDTVRKRNVHYIDTDLIGVMERKKPMLEKLSARIPAIKGKLETISLNALDEAAFNEIADHFEEGPILVLNEGLLMYLDENEKEKLCRIIHELLISRGGYWITGDIYIKGEMERLNEKSEDALKELTAEQRIEDNMFESFGTAESFFRKCNFIIDGESNVEFSKLSSLKYLLGNASTDQLLQLNPSHTIRTTWRLKAVKR